MSGQQSLRNFYYSLKVTNPRLAVMIMDDMLEVVLNATIKDVSNGQDAANSLREQTSTIPEPLRRVLENALTELGYS